VSYDKKRNEANAEDNRDGRDDNLSWNSASRATRTTRTSQRLRAQRARNFVALLMLSQGVPMLVAGDEVLRSQRGNNNAYCQDNDLSWLDWSFAPGAREMLRFTRELVALRSAIRRCAAHASSRRQRRDPLVRRAARDAELGRRRGARAVLRAERARSRTSRTCTS